VGAGLVAVAVAIVASAVYSSRVSHAFICLLRRGNPAGPR
jgi:hypothetical protein